ncbi:MAG: pantoate--beta-alanine ligase, partial [Bacilli bacterium]
PRDLERDIEMATEGGIDIVFAPSVMEMYPNPLFTKVTVSGLTDRLCGSSRPGHFDGVATVVSKLFHIIEPDSAYFGQKDAQQLAVIEQMVKDLNFNVSIVPCPTIREVDGLAMSSRNVYLTSEERNQAVVLSQALKQIEKTWLSGKRDLTFLQSEAREIISQAPLAKIDYVEILSYPELIPIHYEQNIKYVVALAVYFGKTRLIDNVILA